MFQAIRYTDQRMWGDNNKLVIKGEDQQYQDEYGLSKASGVENVPGGQQHVAIDFSIIDKECMILSIDGYHGSFQVRHIVQWSIAGLHGYQDIRYHAGDQKWDGENWQEFMGVVIWW